MEEHYRDIRGDGQRPSSAPPRGCADRLYCGTTGRHGCDSSAINAVPADYRFGILGAADDDVIRDVPADESFDARGASGDEKPLKRWGVRVSGINLGSEIRLAFELDKRRPLSPSPTRDEATERVG